VDPEDLEDAFPEMRPFLSECRFADCTHLQEPGCAIIAAVAAGKIGQQRYESYASLRRGEPIVETGIDQRETVN
jgi:ribosome biogenesis GTPase